jgi:hypothetical protein
MRSICLLTLLLFPLHATWAQDSPVPLQPGPGQQDTQAVCSLCHSTDYIVMNSRFLTTAQWAAEVAKMRSAFGAPLDDAVAAKITAYLASAYGVGP